MLNRRSLRIKAAQMLYAFTNCKNANREIAVDQLKQRFEPDLNSMELQDRDVLKQEKSIALRIFNENFPNLRVKADENIPDKIVKEVEAVFIKYENNLKNDFNFLRKLMLNESEKILDHFLLVLTLLIEFSELSDGNFSKKSEKYENKNFRKNQIIEALKNDQKILEEIKKRKISWGQHRDSVINWFKDSIYQTSEFKEYKALENASLDQDRKFITYLIKSVILKEGLINTFFEERDINWEEDKTIIKSMVLKTLKSVEKQDGIWTVELSRLSYNWEDDKEYFGRLFTLSMENDNDYEQLISEKSKNWDVKRLALMDKIILKMALCEMINFPSIPVKVTINEYIEISKRYSTPKSKQFVNGLLDVLAGELKASNVIKKSGRGLIDNK